LSLIALCAGCGLNKPMDFSDTSEAPKVKSHAPPGFHNQFSFAAHTQTAKGSGAAPPVKPAGSDTTQAAKPAEKADTAHKQ
jgi:hypothetical protein